MLGFIGMMPEWEAMPWNGMPGMGIAIGTGIGCGISIGIGIGIGVGMDIVMDWQWTSW